MFKLNSSRKRFQAVLFVISTQDIANKAELSKLSLEQIVIIFKQSLSIEKK